MTRSIVEKIQNTIEEYATIGDLKSGVITGGYSPATADFSRSFLWKAVLILNSLDILPTAIKGLRESRQTFLFLSTEYFPPFSRLSSDSPYYVNDPLGKSLCRNPNIKQNLIGTKRKRVQKPLSNVVNDPLSGSLERDLEELNTIILDVERIFPGFTFFQDFSVKKNLIQLLYIWYKLNQDVGYRQGMHEIAAVIYLIVCEESLQDAVEDDMISEVLDIKYSLSDTFHMFTILMINPQASYFVETNLLAVCREFETLLCEFDYDLYVYFNETLQLESQIWLIRWYRLLLNRELTLPVVLPLWDKLISFQQIKNLSNLTSNSDFNIIVSSVILVLLLYIKELLIVGCDDYGDVLKVLLNYPIDIFFGKEQNKNDINKNYLEESPRVINSVNQLFNEALLVFNSRDNLAHVGKFLNEKHNPAFVKLNQTVKEDTFIRNQGVLNQLRFENRLKKRVKQALKR